MLRSHRPVWLKLTQLLTLHGAVSVEPRDHRTTCIKTIKHGWQNRKQHTSPWQEFQFKVADVSVAKFYVKSQSCQIATDCVGGNVLNKNHRTEMMKPKTNSSSVEHSAPSVHIKQTAAVPRKLMLHCGAVSILLSWSTHLSWGKWSGTGLRSPFWMLNGKLWSSTL